MGKARSPPKSGTIANIIPSFKGSSLFTNSVRSTEKIFYDIILLRLARDKRSSLFGLFISDNVVKLFYFVTDEENK